MKTIDRTKCIGGGEISAIVGINPYQSPLDVYLRKFGLIEVPETQAMRLGKRLEPIVAGLYCDATGRGGYHLNAEILHHQHLPWVIGTPDILFPEDHIGVELKTAGIRQAPNWGSLERTISPPCIAPRLRGIRPLRAIVNGRSRC